jgi:hypothetical protein
MRRSLALRDFLNSSVDFAIDFSASESDRKAVLASLEADVNQAFRPTMVFRVDRLHSFYLGSFIS